VVPGFLVGGFIEFPDQLFKGASHFEIGHLVGMEVDFAEFLDQLEEAVRFIELLDLLVEAEIVE